LLAIISNDLVITIVAIITAVKFASAVIIANIGFARKLFKSN